MKQITMTEEFLLKKIEMRCCFWPDKYPDIILQCSKYPQVFVPKIYIFGQNKKI